MRVEGRGPCRALQALRGSSALQTDSRRQGEPSDLRLE